MNYREWLTLKHGGTATVGKYYRAVYCDRVNELLLQVTDAVVPLYEMTDLEQIEDYVGQLLKHPVFKEFDTVGHRMYSSGLKNFLRYHRSISDTDLVEKDIKDIESDAAITDTERLALCRARIGQGEYRRSLIKRWQGRCAVTDYVDERLLVASHVKPWSLSTDEERLDCENGLLLTPNLDKAFDRGFITFEPKNGRIRISGYLKTPAVLGIAPELKLRSLSKPLNEYLKFHGERIFLHNV